MKHRKWIYSIFGLVVVSTTFNLTVLYFEKAQKILPLVVPEQEKILGEISENKYSPTFFDFAEELQEKVMVAEGSKEAALALLGDIENCIKGHSTAAIEAVCYLEGERLLRVIPEYKGRKELLMFHMSEQALELVNDFYRI